MKKIILLSGATGFVGQHFIEDFSDVYDIKTISLRKTSIQDLDLNGIDCVVHCAALVHQMNGAPSSEYFRVNTEITSSFANAAQKAGVKHFIFLSTSHVYGDAGNCNDHKLTYNEQSFCNPTDPYGQSKLAAEEKILSMQSAQFAVSVLRPPLVYGRGAKGNLINLCKLIEKSPALPFNFKKNRRSIVYVKNLTYFIHLTIESKKSGIFLPQDETTLSIYELTNLLGKNIKTRLYLFELPKTIYNLLLIIFPKIMIRLYGTLAFDSTTSNLAVSYHPKYSTNDGLKEMAKHYLLTNSKQR